MRILLPVDGSPHAMAAAGFVAALAPFAGRTPTVTLLNVQPRVTGEVERLVGKARLREIREHEAHDAVAAAMRALRDARIEPTLEIRVGNAGEEIAERARNEGADLIVMGARGLGEIVGLVFGSETTKVLAACDTPLLVVRKAPTVAADSALEVGIAIDGSDYGIAAVRHALANVALFGPRARFTLIHVVPDFGAPIPADIATPVAMYSSDEIENLQARQYEHAMAPARALFAARDIRCEEARLTGAPAEEIARYAHDRGLDLIVMGSHGHGRFVSAVLGSVALRLAAKCDLPLLLVRRP